MGRLSEREEALLSEISSNWIKMTLEKRPFNKPVIQTFIDLLYWAKGLREPEIHYVLSPLACQNIALELKLARSEWKNLSREMLTHMEHRIFDLPDIQRKLSYHIWGGAKIASLAKIHIEMEIKRCLMQVFEEFANDLRSAQWCAYYNFCCDAEYIKRRRGIIDIYCEYACSGVFFTIYETSHVIVCANPSEIKFNDSGQLHSEEGAAVSWADGSKLYFRNGIAVPEKSVTSSLDNQYGFLLRFIEKTAEIRRELSKKHSADVFAKGLKARMLDKCQTKWALYELISVDLSQQGRALTCLSMLNPSTGEWHIETVPNVSTCREALAWRDSESKYNVPVNLT